VLKKNVDLVDVQLTPLCEVVHMEPAHQSDLSLKNFIMVKTKLIFVTIVQMGREPVSDFHRGFLQAICLENILMLVTNEPIFPPVRYAKPVERFDQFATSDAEAAVAHFTSTTPRDDTANIVVIKETGFKFLGIEDKAVPLHDEYHFGVDVGKQLIEDEKAVFGLGTDRMDIDDLDITLSP